MRTKTYAQLIELIQALCGVAFAPIELPRIKALVNSRAKRAYDACDYWQRFLIVGQERQIVNGVIPLTEGTLPEIDTFLFVYRFQPFNVNSTQYLDISVGPDGAIPLLGPLELTSCWVTYKAVNASEYGDGSQGEDTAIPAEWFEYLAHGVYSDFMRAEGQQEKAVIADQEANSKLEDELFKISTQGTINLVANRISTNAGMQTRYSGGYWNP